MRCTCHPEIRDANCFFHGGKYAPIPQLEMEIFALVRIRMIGLPEVHKDDIIARVTREMELAFAGNAETQEVWPVEVEDGAHTVWVLPAEVVSGQVQRVHQEPEVPEVPSEETDAGS